MCVDRTRPRRRQPVQALLHPARGGPGPTAPEGPPLALQEGWVAGGRRGSPGRDVTRIALHAGSTRPLRTPGSVRVVPSFDTLPQGLTSFKMRRMAHPGRLGALPPISMRYVASRRYEVVFGEDVLNPNDRALSDLVGQRRGLVITTPSVDLHYGGSFTSYATHHRLDIRVAVLELGESRKTIETVAEVAGLAQEMGLGRRDVLIGFGGGVCCDIVSYAASSIRRGIPHVFIPTTLVGQVDAAIGLKGGVNFNRRKNYLGCFEAPRRRPRGSQLPRDVVCSRPPVGDRRDAEDGTPARCPIVLGARGIGNHAHRFSVHQAP